MDADPQQQRRARRQGQRHGDAVLEDDQACISELARFVGVSLATGTPDAELAAVLAGVPLERRAAIVDMVRGMVAAFGLPPLPPGTTVVQDIMRAAEIQQRIEKAKRGK